METPSSMRRVTRSQASSLASQKKMQQDEAAAEKSLPARERTQVKNPERSVLLDITNDSPIVGLAVGSLKTPSSSVAKSRRRGWPAAAGRTPGSGEALLRGQVKTLLQKVEEGVELVKLPAENTAAAAAPFRALLGHLKSPGCLLAPTPANTPEILSASGDKEGFISVMPSVQEEDDLEVSDIPKQEETLDLHECLINRALMFDSPDKSEISDSSSVLTCLEKSPEDDCSSTWSIQANASTQEEEEYKESEGVDNFEEEDEEEDYCYDEEEEEEDYCYDEEEEEEEGGEALASLCEGLRIEALASLCEGLRMMSVQEKRGLPEFVGKHMRFVYNSDDEIEGEEEVGARALSPSVLLLKGLPVPEGKHLRFQEEEEEGDAMF